MAGFGLYVHRMHYFFHLHSGLEQPNCSQVLRILYVFQSAEVLLTTYMIGSNQI